MWPLVQQGQQGCLWQAEARPLASSRLEAQREHPLASYERSRAGCSLARPARCDARSGGLSGLAAMLCR